MASTAAATVLTMSSPAGHNATQRPQPTQRKGSSSSALNANLWSTRCRYRSCFVARGLWADVGADAAAQTVLGKPLPRTVLEAILQDLRPLPVDRASLDLPGNRFLELRNALAVLGRRRRPAFSAIADEVQALVGQHPQQPALAEGHELDIAPLLADRRITDGRAEALRIGRRTGGRDDGRVLPARRVEAVPGAAQKDLVETDDPGSVTAPHSEEHLALIGHGRIFELDGSTREVVAIQSLRPREEELLGRPPGLARRFDDGLVLRRDPAEQHEAVLFDRRDDGVGVKEAVQPLPELGLGQLPR